MIAIARHSAVLLCFFALCACKSKAPEAPPPSQGVPLAREDVVRVERKTIQTGPRISGSLDPRNRADVRAEAGGSVIAVSGELGQTVKKGHVLAKIEARAQADSLLSSEAAKRSATLDLDVARREVERTEALVEGGALPRRDIDQARSAAAAAQARVEEAHARVVAARTTLGNATVIAPMDGVISQAMVHQGDVVAPGAPLFTIIDPRSMRLEASVSSENMSELVVGTQVRFKVRGYPGQEFVGRIERIAPAADPATRQIPLLIEIPNETGTLVAGLFAEGRLASAERKALVVPEAAVDSSGEQPSVTRLENDVVERVTVQVGLRDSAAEVIEIISGLAEGDQVLVRAARGLTPGTKVTLPGGVQAAPPAPQPAPMAAPPAPNAAPVPAPAPSATPDAATRPQDAAPTRPDAQ